MTKAKKQKKWTHPRHGVARNIIAFILTPVARIKYGYTAEKFKEQGKRPYLILLNHQTAFDQFFVGMAFKGAVYYMASEDIFSKGFVSSLIRYLVAPIPIKKQTTDVRAILNCLKVAREGGTVAIAPEGNRTYSGRTEYMSPSIAPLARKLGLPIALFRIEGGYGVQPRWSDVIRKGRMRGYVSRVIEPEEYAALTDGQLFSLIENGLYVDEAVADASFYHKRSAEYLERALYVCPHCGLSTLESHGDLIECTLCHRQVRYGADKRLSGVDHEHPFPFVAQWYDYQKDLINSLDLRTLCESPCYRETVSLLRVIPCERKELICDSACIRLFGDRICVSANGEELCFPFADLPAVTVLGRNKLNIYHADGILQIKGSKRFNALKYVHFYNRYRNILKGDDDVKFLGL